MPKESLLHFYTHVLLILTLGLPTVLADYQNFTLIMEPVETKVFGKSQSTSKKEIVDYVLVRKKERLLILYSGDELVKSYSIVLGKQPEGHKQQEGDSRTPEGIYTLDWRNPHSKFYRSIHVSYPNRQQLLAAREAGINPGGEIMIHGQPSNWSERIKLTFKETDWTEGCIALENQDMLEVWNLVRDGTLIEIKP
ncbi:MAG: L,D-transpeptidase family protein [Pseudomonadota bacterium]